MTVTVAGPLQQLEQLTADMFAVQVDLTGYGLGNWELVPVFQGMEEGKFPNMTVTLREQRIHVTLVSAAEAGPSQQAPEETEPETNPAQTP